LTLAPIFGASTRGALTEYVNKTLTGPALASVSNVLPLAGGVAMKSGDEFIWRYRRRRCTWGRFG